MDLKSLYLLNTHVVTCRAVGLCGFRNSLLVEFVTPLAPPLYVLQGFSLGLSQPQLVICVHNLLFISYSTVGVSVLCPV